MSDVKKRLKLLNKSEYDDIQYLHQRSTGWNAKGLCHADNGEESRVVERERRVDIKERV